MTTQHTPSISCDKFPPRRNHRGGMAMICVMVALVIVSALGATMLRTTLLQQRRMRLAHQAIQVDWLIQAGLERAVYQRSRDLAYQGETWQLSPPEIVGKSAASLEIHRCEFSPADALAGMTAATHQLWEISVRYPVESPTSIHRTRRFMVAEPAGPPRAALSEAP